MKSLNIDKKATQRLAVITAAVIVLFQLFPGFVTVITMLGTVLTINSLYLTIVNKPKNAQSNHPTVENRLKLQGNSYRRLAVITAAVIVLFQLFPSFTTSMLMLGTALTINKFISFIIDSKPKNSKSNLCTIENRSELQDISPHLIS